MSTIVSAPTRIAKPDRKRILPCLLLGAILLVGLYLRAAHLKTVQHFGGDQGRDYLEVMRWLQQGRWPLLGPARAGGGDFALGPGWFYTIAPALALGWFHPSAGGLFMAAVGTLTVFFAWLWVKRTSGSQAAALVTAAVLALAAGRIEVDRTLWNPHILPLATLAVALLLDAVRRRPLPALALLLMLFAILPQWHSTGVPIIVAATIPLGWAAWGARGRIRQAPRRQWLRWGTALTVAVALLYVPPTVNEFTAKKSNLKHYFSNTMIPSAPAQGSPARRGVLAAKRLSEITAQSVFSWRLDERPTALRMGAVLLALLFAGACTHALRRGAVEPSLVFFFLLLVGFWLIITLKGDSVLDYYLMPVLITPVLLAGWTAGRLLGAKGAGPGRRNMLRAGGAALLAAALVLTSLQLPQAWGIPQGRVWYGRTFAGTQQIAEYIARDAGKKSFSLSVLQVPNGYHTEYFCLLRRLGKAATNEITYASPTVWSNLMGEETYVVVRNVRDGKPIPVEFKGSIKPPGRPVRVADARIYRLAGDGRPVGLRAIKVTPQGGGWLIEALTR